MALDVYCLTRHRDLTTLNRFLDEYVDRPANEDRGDEEILFEPVERQWEWEPALTLTHILERGLSHPRRAFRVYLSCLQVCHDAGIERAILGFTRDDQLVLGLSIPISPDEADDEADEARAQEFLTHLAEAYGCHLGLILLEEPPPLSEAEFRQPTEDLHVIFRTSFDV